MGHLIIITEKFESDYISLLFNTHQLCQGWVLIWSKYVLGYPWSLLNRPSAATSAPVKFIDRSLLMGWLCYLQTQPFAHTHPSEIIKVLAMDVGCPCLHILQPLNASQVLRWVTTPAVSSTSYRHPHFLYYSTSTQPPPFLWYNEDINMAELSHFTDIQVLTMSCTTWMPAPWDTITKWASSTTHRSFCISLSTITLSVISHSVSLFQPSLILPSRYSWGVSQIHR